MRIGLLGPTDDEEVLREAASFLVGDADADQVVFLGDGYFLERTLARWAESFLDRALAVAQADDARAVEHLLTEDAATRRLLTLRRLPDAPARAIELLDDRIVLFVHDKAVLDEEDIANSHVIVYGRSPEAQLHKFGRRAFFTPGPLSLGRVGLLEANEEGASVAVYDISGMPVLREPLAGAATRVTVST